MAAVGAAFANAVAIFIPACCMPPGITYSPYYRRCRHGCISWRPAMGLHVVLWRPPSLQKWPTVAIRQRATDVWSDNVELYRAQLNDKFSGKENSYSLYPYGRDKNADEHEDYHVTFQTAAMYGVFPGALCMPVGMGTMPFAIKVFVPRLVQVGLPIGSHPTCHLNRARAHRSARRTRKGTRGAKPHSPTSSRGHPCSTSLPSEKAP